MQKIKKLVLSDIVSPDHVLPQLYYSWWLTVCLRVSILTLCN